MARTDFFSRAKSELVDKYTANFTDLTSELQQVSETNTQLQHQQTQVSQ